MSSGSIPNPIQLSPESLAFVEQRVAIGHYQSREAVVEAGLAALRELELAALREQLDPALAELDCGEGTEFSIERIKQLGRAKLAQA